MKNRYERGLIHLIKDVKYVICPYCNKNLKWLNYGHLKIHNKTLTDVRKEFPEVPTMTLIESQNRKKARQSCTEKIRKTCEKKYGGIGFASKQLEKKTRDELEKKYGNRNIMKTDHGKNFFVGEKNPAKRPEVRKQHSINLKKRIKENGGHWFKGKTYIELFGKEKTKELIKLRKKSGAIGQSLTPRISAPQLELYKLVKKKYPTAILEYPYLDFCLDIAVPDKKICFEYDSSYWHQDPEKDKKRDKILSQLGWKVIRFRDSIPSNI
jgi:very-short-patch-repair endonuclease